MADDGKKDVTLRMRMTAEERRLLDMRAKRRGQNTSEYVRAKLNQGDLPPFLAEMVQDLAESVGMDAGTVRSRIVAGFFARIEARRHAYGGTQTFPELADNGFEGVQFFTVLCQQYIDELERERENALLDGLRHGAPLTDEDSDWLYERRTGPRYWGQQADETDKQTARIEKARADGLIDKDAEIPARCVATLATLLDLFDDGRLTKAGFREQLALDLQPPNAKWEAEIDASKLGPQS